MREHFDLRIIDRPDVLPGAFLPSKLNETARSYKTITLETKELVDFTFVWFTDGQGWKSARNNLEETFDVLEHIYNISDMENGIINEVMK